MASDVGQIGGDKTTSEASGSADAPVSPMDHDFVAEAKRILEDDSQQETGHESSLLKQIAELRATQNKMKEDKKKLQKEMRNAMKRKRRIQSRVSQLSELDIVEVLRMRQSKRGAGAEWSADED